MAKVRQQAGLQRCGKGRPLWPATAEHAVAAVDRREGRTGLGAGGIPRPGILCDHRNRRSLLNGKTFDGCRELIGD